MMKTALLYVLFNNGFSGRKIIILAKFSFLFSFEMFHLEITHTVELDTSNRIFNYDISCKFIQPLYSVAVLNIVSNASHFMNMS